MNLIIVATSIGFGMIPIAAPNFYDHFPAGSRPFSTRASAPRRSWRSC
jgi:xanthine/uracil permease